jgi:hypothetical protein
MTDSEHAAFGVALMGTADRLADEVGVWATRSGHTVDDVTLPLWEGIHAQAHHEKGTTQ